MEEAPPYRLVIMRQFSLLFFLFYAASKPNRSLLALTAENMVHCAGLQCHLRYDDEVYTQDYEEGYEEAPEAGFGEGPPLLLAVASPSLEFLGVRAANLFQCCCRCAAVAAYAAWVSWRFGS